LRSLDCIAEISCKFNLVGMDQRLLPNDLRVLLFSAGIGSPKRTNLAMKLFELILCPLLVFATTSAFAAAPLEGASGHCDRVTALVKVAEELRGLDALEPVRCLALDDKLYGERAAALSRSSNTLSDIQYQEIAYKIIGLIPIDYPYTHCFLDMAGDLSDALYDRNTKEIVIRSQTAVSNQVLVHEIIHALQDQHFNLSKLRQGIELSDHDLAVAALVEGDAVIVEERYQQLVQSSPESLGAANQPECMPPEPLFSVFMFPYEWGRRFIQILSNHDPESINRAFHDPPQTTRQVLYPEEYLGSTPPHGQPYFHPAEVAGYKKLYSDMLGEYVLRSLFRTYSGRSYGILAARGWQSDLMELYRQGDNYMIVWRILLEGSDDIEQFFDALRRYSASRFGFKVDRRATRWIATTTSGITFEVQTEKQEVTIRFLFVFNKK